MFWYACVDMASTRSEQRVDLILAYFLEDGEKTSRKVKRAMKGKFPPTTITHYEKYLENEMIKIHI